MLNHLVSALKFVKFFADGYHKEAVQSNDAVRKKSSSSSMAISKNLFASTLFRWCHFDRPVVQIVLNSNRCSLFSRVVANPWNGGSVPAFVSDNKCESFLRKKLILSPEIPH